MEEERTGKTPKVNVVLPQGYAGGTVEVVLREGKAHKPLHPKAPVKTNLCGVIGCVFEYLNKRVHTGQFNQHRSHLIVDRQQTRISLVVNEKDAYERGEVTGKLEFHPKFAEFGINTGKVWTPFQLGMFFKMNRAFFANKEENMALVTALTNFTATVNSSLEKSLKETGDRTDHFAQTVNSNLPNAFKLRIPIFKGMSIEEIEVETFANIDGREVSFILLSPGANQALEDVRDKVIDGELDKIRARAPGIAILEV